MKHDPLEECVSCGVALVIGPFFHDYIAEFRRRGLRRTFGFEFHRGYEKLFGHEHSDDWGVDVTPENCDSVFVGCVIDRGKLCPRCGKRMFA